MRDTIDNLTIDSALVSCYSHVAGSMLPSLTADPSGKSGLSALASAFARGEDIQAHSTMGGPAEPFRESLWVHLCITAITQTAAGVPIRLSVGEPDATVRAFAARRVRCGLQRARKTAATVTKAATGEIVSDGELARLLERPNPEQTWRQFVEQTVGLLYCHGRVHWLFDEMVGNRPTTMYVVPGKHSEPVVIKSGRRPRLVGWRLPNANDSSKFPAALNECITFALFNPDDPYAGLSPRTPGRLAIVSDFNASLYNASMFGNSAEPGGILKTPARFDAALDAQMKTSWNQRHQGAAKAKTVGVLWGGMEWQSVASTMVEMQFIEGKRLSREEICAIYRVPPSVAGFMGTTGDSTAYATVDWQRFWQDTIGPLLDMIGEAVQLHLASRFVGNLDAWFDVEDVPVVQEMRRGRLDAVDKLWPKGVPMADLNALYDLGLPERPWHGTGFLAAGLLPAADVSAGNIMPSMDEPPQITPDSPGETPEDDGPTPEPPAPRSSLSVAEKAIADRLWAAWARSWDGLAKAQGNMFRSRLSVQQRKTLAALKREMKAVKNDGVVARVLLGVFGDAADKKAWRVKVRQFVLDANELGIRQALAEAGLTGTDLDNATRALLSNPRIRTAIENQAVQISTRLDDGTRELLRRNLSAGLDAGDDMGVLTDRVQDVMGSRRSAALGISRNAVAQTMSQARHEGHASVGGKKSWIFSRGPGKRRPAHTIAEAEYREGIPVGEPFVINGVPMSYPRDPSAPMREIANCMCLSILRRDAKGATIPLSREFVTWDQMCAARAADGVGQEA